MNMEYTVENFEADISVDEYIARFCGRRCENVMFL